MREAEREWEKLLAPRFPTWAERKEAENPSSSQGLRLRHHSAAWPAPIA